MMASIYMQPVPTVRTVVLQFICNLMGDTIYFGLALSEARKPSEA